LALKFHPASVLLTKADGEKCLRNFYALTSQDPISVFSWGSSCEQKQRRKMRRAPLTCARVENYQTIEAADEKYIKIDPCAPGNGNPRGISAICTLMALFLKATDRISLSLFLHLLWRIIRKNATEAD
jgi:hypothetical protein